MKKTGDQFLSGGEKTLNNTGYMTGGLDPYSLEFIEFAKNSSGKVADIGACFGVAVLPALEAGAEVIAVDNETRHLEILHQRTDPKYLDKLICITGSLPSNIDLAPNSLSAILCARTLHLLHGDEIDESLENMYDWLEPDGRIYIINDSIYVKYNANFSETFLPIHEENKQKGERWPGHIPNLKDVLYEEFTPMSPGYVTLMDIDSITNACQEYGFDILKAEYMARPDYPEILQNDGRENVCIVVRKPA